MKMQTIQLDISSDIFDKVIAFLDILPKSKIRLKKIDNVSSLFQKSENQEVSLQTLQSKSMSKTWDNREDEAWDEL